MTQDEYDKTFAEAHRHFCLNYLKDDIREAHLHAFNMFDYDPSKNVTATLKQAVRTAMATSYRDITGEDLFTDEEDNAYYSTFRGTWTKIQADSKKLDDLLNEKAPF